MKYLIYTKLGSVCPYCIRALALLDEQGVQYEEIKMPIDEVTAYKAWFKNKFNVDIKTIPQILGLKSDDDNVITTSYIGGYSELVKHFDDIDNGVKLV